MAYAPDSDFLSRNQPPLNQAHTRGRFAGYSVLVTGGAQGIGRSCVERFCSDGAIVGIMDMNADTGAAAVADLTAQGYSATFYQGDVTKPEDCERVCSQFASHAGGALSCLVNCACSFLCRTLNGTNEEFRHSLDVNVVGYFNMVKAAVPFIKKAPAAQRSILNMSSTAGLRAQSGRWTYIAGKGAITSMTKGMALDLRGDSIRVNSLSPAYVWSPEMQKVAPNGKQEYFDEDMKRYSMIGRCAAMSEVAAVVAFLSSVDASFITASDIPVDGGYVSMALDAQATFAGCKE